MSNAARRWQPSLSLDYNSPDYYRLWFADEADHPDSTLVLEKLENIDSETDNLDITFVKMSDSRYARKWGVTKLPAIVYFRKRFPSIYRGIGGWTRGHQHMWPLSTLIVVHLMFIDFGRFLNSLCDIQRRFAFFFSYRRFAVRRWGSRMAAKKSLPSARVEHIHVCIDCDIDRICSIYGVFAAMLQATTEPATSSCQTTID